MHACCEIEPGPSGLQDRVPRQQLAHDVFHNFHAAEPRSYQDVVRIRRMLLEQGADSRILLSRADRA